MKRFFAAAGGTLIGAANGLFGGGGGMVAVPLLERAGLSSRCAHATAIAVILPVCLMSGAVYSLFAPIRMGVLVPTVLGVAAGGFAGAKLLNFLPLRLLDFLFCAVMLLAGVRMLLP